MVVRNRKTTNSKQLGKRTHGHGNTKKNRGAGNRGGRGKGGSQKHKRSKYYPTFGIKVRLHPKAKGQALNLNQLLEKIPKWVEQGKVAEENGQIVLDGKKIKAVKVLGAGKLDKELYIKNMRVSEKARKKIEEADGEIEETFETAGGEAKTENLSAGEADQA
jgi:large subunit ribosomal protein L15